VSRSKSSSPPRGRDFRAEYQRRIAKGFAAGKSKSASRGHARAADLGPGSGVIDRGSALERALSRMKRGDSQKLAAEAEGVSVERLRRFRQQNTGSIRQGRRWVIYDSRPQSYVIAHRGEMKSVVLPYDAGAEVGAYWNAVNRFLVTNDATHLRPYVGEGVRDLSGRFWEFEVRPNTLRRLDAIGELNFIEIYAETAP
jgi:hypothetical protein